MPDLNVRLGPYRLVRILGTGGMGVVYQAEQLEPIQREVAVKLIHAGTEWSDVVVRRFESERQALAVMEHPSIARVFDGGVSEDGRPYFVMELVRGVPLLEYCDARNLSLRARIRLFIQVCRAVQHAHQKGIIHRDLKPSNVLVTEIEGEPLAKVIDFGIARSVAAADGRERITVVGELMGTPAYMSPEQLDARMDVDTRSDVYALGVMLYELFTGNLPFELSEYRSLAMFGVAPLNAPHPAQRISKLGPAVAELAARRSVDPQALVRALRGDLDWIVMKAMDPERERRYETANALAMDLERSLANEPVLARPPSTTYRARKFVRRHTFGVASAALFAVLLAGSAVAQTIQAGRVARARDEAVVRRGQAEGLIDFMLGDLWEKLEPVGQLAILDDVGARAVDYFRDVDPSLFSDDEAASRARMLYNIGSVRIRQGNSVAATAAFQESLRIAQQLSARKPGDTDAQFQLGQSEFWVGSGFYRQARHTDARTHFQAYRDISQALVAKDSAKMEWVKELGYSHTNLGAVELALGNTAAAAAEFRAALAVKERVLAAKPDDRSLRYDVARAHYNLAEALIPAGDLAGALRTVARDIAIKRELLALDSANATWRTTLASSLTTRATAAASLGQADSALAALTEAAAILDRLARADPSNKEAGRGRAINAIRRADVTMASAGTPELHALLVPATEGLATLAAADSARLDLRQDLAYGLRMRAALALREGAAREARAAASSVGALLPPTAPAGSPRLLVLYGASARVMEGTANALLGEQDAARGAWREAVRLSTGLVAAGDDPLALATAAEAQLRLGQRTQADGLLARLRRTGFRERGFVQRLKELGVQY